MSKIMQEPPVDPARNYFSQQCVLLTGMASGVVDVPRADGPQTHAYVMGRRDAFHVVVAHLASSRSLRDAAEKCAAFGRGVGERSDAHPYGTEWCSGFSHAALEAAADIAMYAASGMLPTVDAARLRAARAAVRHVSPLGASEWAQRALLLDPPRSHHEW
jgi:hypothetical protein